MSKRNKSNRKAQHNSADKVARAISQNKYNRQAVISWCKFASDYLTEIAFETNDESLLDIAENAAYSAAWCKSASASAFNAQCDFWAKFA